MNTRNSTKIFSMIDGLNSSSNLNKKIKKPYLYLRKVNYLITAIKKNQEIIEEKQIQI